MIKIEFPNGETGYLSETNELKAFKSERYKYIFNKINGSFARFGKTLEDDGDLELGLPEIADIEISTICHGIHNIPCAFCYKANTGTGTNMSLDTFKKVFAKLPHTVTQIAFGIGDIDSNPDMFDIFQYARDNGVVPNVTINGDRLTDEICLRLSKVCGAVAVSYYDHELTCNAVQRLTDLGMTQVNIHFFLAANTLKRASDLLNTIKSEPRLNKLNAVVFLSLKQKGRASCGFDCVSQDEFTSLVNLAFANGVNIGFDSCSAVKFIEAVKNHPKYEQFKDMAEPCESSIYSSYINTDGFYFPCSFMEGEGEWKEGLDVVNCNDFLQDIWWNEKTLRFKEKLLKTRGLIGCPVFTI